VYGVMLVAGRRLSLDEAFEEAFDSILQAVNGQAACLHQIGGGHLRLFAQRGLADGQQARLETLPGDWLADEGGIYLASDALSVGLPPFMCNSEFGAYVGAPIRVAGQRAGVLSLFWTGARSFSVEDIALLRAIAQQVSVILDGIRLRERVAAAAALNERRHLAADLHDWVTQSLHSLVLTADNARTVTQRGQFDQLDRLMTQLCGGARQALKEMLLLLYEWRLLSSDQIDLVGQLQLRLDAVERRAGLDVQLVVEDRAVVSQPWVGDLYAILVEALNNSLKHSRATQVRVLLSGDARQIAIEVADNGVGFDPALAPRVGTGLRSMAEHAQRLGGALSVEAAPGAGARVRLSLAHAEAAGMEG